MQIRRRVCGRDRAVSAGTMADTRRERTRHSWAQALLSRSLCVLVTYTIEVGDYASGTSAYFEAVNTPHSLSHRATRCRCAMAMADAAD
eukprot:6234979-Prymnesium_polylepis.1